MYRNKETAREKHNRLIKNFDNLAKTLQASKAMQMRFTLLPEKAINNVTKAGVRDMNLGPMGTNSKPVGANVIRFNNPSPETKSDYHRLFIDPKGVSNKANYHKELSAGTIKAAENIQTGLKWTGKGLLVVSIMTTGVRIGKAIYDEIDIDSEIAALENIIDTLKEDLKKGGLKNKRDTENALIFAEGILDDARDCKRNPGKKTVLTSLCIGGEWCGAATLGYAGAQVGAAVGAPGGPVGAVAGAITGSVVGAIAGSELGASAVENFRCDENGIGTEMQGSLLDIHNAHVLDLDANVYVGVEGVEVGARGALFQISDKDKSLTYGKAGANFGITDKGVDVGVEGKVAWLEHETKDSKIGFGLNVDTEIKADERNFQASVLGFGFSSGDDGFGLHIPFCSYTWK
ncbi:unnamed protein product [Medioppia subpectinata]|uniref:Uncharacterized protein n=1 Tax=Medioppia subpectinata TaxID=1979941 RepID=A0A7R9KS86_9ACAR|nr:unnamed protein product [Medioppia subpectinata]CAG2107661.1 unnamed protein product [Medioppia subpectinata]